MQTFLRTAPVLRAAALAAALLFAASAGATGEVRRIVSLGPTITEQLGLLKSHDRLVGATTFCRLPESAESIARIGTVTGTSVEKIIALRPDLVLATSMTHPRYTDKLEQLGIRLVRVSYPRDFEEICEQLLELGTLIDRSELAERIVAQARQRVETVEERVAGRPRPSVFVEVGVRPLFTAPGDSYINDIVQRAGGSNIAADAKTGFYSREKVVAANPQHIVIVAMGIVAEQERDAWREVEALRAARSGNVHIADADMVCSATPPRFADALETFAALFHPVPADTP